MLLTCSVATAGDLEEGVASKVEGAEPASAARGI